MCHSWCLIEMKKDFFDAIFREIFYLIKDDSIILFNDRTLYWCGSYSHGNLDLHLSNYNPAPVSVVKKISSYPVHYLFAIYLFADFPVNERCLHDWDRLTFAW